MIIKNYTQLHTDDDINANFIIVSYIFFVLGLLVVEHNIQYSIAIIASSSQMLIFQSYNFYQFQLKNQHESKYREICGSFFFPRSNENMIFSRKKKLASHTHDRTQSVQFKKETVIKCHSFVNDFIFNFNIWFIRLYANIFIQFNYYLQQYKYGIWLWVVVNGKQNMKRTDNSMNGAIVKNGPIKSIKYEEQKTFQYLSINRN